MTMRVFWTFFACSFLWSLIILTTMYPVYAQAVVDVRPAATSVLEWVAGILGTVLTVLGSFGIRFISTRIGMANSELEASLATRLNDIIHRGIDYAYTAALNEVNKPGSGLEAVKFDNWFMSIAASYISRSAPEILKKFGITQERLEDMIMSRLPNYAGTIPIAGGLPRTETVRQAGNPLSVLNQ